MSSEAVSGRQQAAASIRAVIVAEWMEKRAMIEAAIEKVVAELGDSGLPEVASYLAAGGKRFRGFLTLLAAEALGGRAEDALDAAVAVELVQAASLAIDDIIDGDEYRRGRRAAHLVHGVAKTVLASLLLIPVSQRLVEKLGFKALYHVIRAWENTVRGEILDAFLAELVPADRYLEVSRLKTGSLFRLSLILGALSANADQETVEKLGRYGDLLGIIYQLADDIADYKNSQKGSGKKKEPGLALFEKWAKTRHPQARDPAEAALEDLAQHIRAAKAIIESLNLAREKAIILEHIPEFMAEKMLEEAGLHVKLALLLQGKD